MEHTFGNDIQNCSLVYLKKEKQFYEEYINPYAFCEAGHDVVRVKFRFVRLASSTCKEPFLSGIRSLMFSVRHAQS